MVLVVLLGGMVILMPKDAVLNLAANRFAEATGRKIQIGSGAKVALWPVLGVSAGPVTISNADWGSEPQMLTADRISIGLDVAAALSGHLQITEISLTRPDLLLERTRDGKVNWEFAPPAETSDGAATAPDRRITLGSMTISDGRLRFRDSGAKDAFTLEKIEAATAIPDFAGPVQIAGSVEYRGQTIDAEAGVDALSRFLEGEPVALDLALKTGGNTLTFKGKAGTAPTTAEGALNLSVNDREALGRLAGAALPDLPQGFGARSLAAKGQVTLRPDGTVRLRDAEILADDRTWQVDGTWEPGQSRPRLVATVAVDALTLGASGGGSGAGSDTGPDEGWSTDKIDGSALGLMDAEVTLTAGSIRAGGLGLGPTRARLTLDNARAVIGIDEAEVYGGTLAGKIVVNARKGLSSSAALQLDGADLQPLLTDVAGTARLAGKAHATIDLLASGQTLAALMRNMSGTVALRMGKGELVGFDVVGMLRTMDPGYVGEGRKTLFSALTISAAIKGGVAKSDDLVLTGDVFAATGKGQVDIGERRVNYRLLPSLTISQSQTQPLTVPVLISGPWGHPNVRLDLEWLASERARTERRRAEEAAKTRLEELARQKLGVERNGDESLEDAARRRAQEAVAAEAERLLRDALGGSN
jgi:AsmA protein